MVIFLPPSLDFSFSAVAFFSKYPDAAQPPPVLSICPRSSPQVPSTRLLPQAPFLLLCRCPKPLLPGAQPDLLHHALHAPQAARSRVPPSLPALARVVLPALARA
jgi:hypothetical protein